MGSGEGLGGCHALIKYLMFGFNFIFWLVGCALVGVGIWTMVDKNFTTLAESNSLDFLQYAGIIMISIGSVIMVIGFFGCCGAIRESQCLLTMFFICMLILFLALVAAGVVVLMYKDEVIMKAKTLFKKEVDEYEEGEKSYIDFVQEVFKCCGANNGADYGLEKPPSSCSVESYLKGCNTVVPEQLDSYSALVAGVALGAGALMLLGMIFSMLLCCAIRDSE